MTLTEKVLKLYPDLTDTDFVGSKATIVLQNDSDGRGDYIAKWEHPEYPQPTQEQLDGIE